MTSILMKEPCGSPCGEEAEYLITFKVDSLEMLDGDCDEKFKNVLMVITWDSNVFKIEKADGDDDVFNEKVELTFRLTPEQFSKKLKTCPIMIDLSRGCNELGTLKLSLTECFCDAVLCSDFTAEKVSNEFSFVKNEEENATMEAFLRIEKLPSDGFAESLFKAATLKLASKKSAKKPKQNKAGKQKKKTEGGAGSDDDSGSDSDSEKGSCNDFVCPDELPEHCKNIGLNEHVYRVINGNLINTKTKVGPCGEKCPVARKYIKELCMREKPTQSSEFLPFSTKLQLADNQPKCKELFESFQFSCKKQPKVQSREHKCHSKSSRNDAWIDRNINEEDLLKKLCEKHGIRVEDVQSVGRTPIDMKKCKQLKKKKKTKKVEKCSVTAKEAENSEPMPPTREKFIQKMKRKSRRKYCYTFGNSQVNLEVKSRPKTDQGGGDALIVPKYMGWRWDEPIPGTKAKKWYPGQINKTVRCLMKHALNPFPYDTLPLTRRDHNGKIMNTCNKYAKWSEIDISSLKKPTLQIQKKDGEFHITMHPLKDKKSLETDCIPHLNCAPLMFKLKQHPEDVKKHRAKKILRQKGFSKICPCDDMRCCRCISETTKKLLTYEMHNVSKNLNLEAQLKYSDLYDSSDSELDLEFTPPAGVIDPRKCKPDLTHGGTQFLFADFIPPRSTKCLKVSEPCKMMTPNIKLSKPKAQTKKLTIKSK